MVSIRCLAWDGRCRPVTHGCQRIRLAKVKYNNQYGKMAVELKAENKELADMFYNMANIESTHLDNIYSWLVKFIDKEKKGRVDPIPQGMLDVWEWEHKQMIEEMMEAKVVLQSYQKM